MSKRTKLNLQRTNGKILFSESSKNGALEIEATQYRPGHFNEHVNLEIPHPEAVRLYFWLAEYIYGGPVGDDPVVVTTD